MKGPIKRHYEGFRQHKNKEEQGGVITLTGAFLLDHHDEVVNLINHEGRIAEEKNPLHRVSRIDRANGGIVVETTDHNLALRIGKALSHAYKGAHTYKFPKGEKFVEVDWRRD